MTHETVRKKGEQKLNAWIARVTLRILNKISCFFTFFFTHLDDDDLLDDGGDFDLEANSDASSGNGNDSNDAVPEKRRGTIERKWK